MPHVYNIDFNDAPAGAVYCGRGTKYGNPFIMGHLWRGKRMTRDVVCDRFDREVLPRLDVSELRGKDLLCHCAPFRCHCDSILKKANRVPTLAERWEAGTALVDCIDTSCNTQYECMMKGCKKNGQGQPDPRGEARTQRGPTLENNEARDQKGDG